MDKIITQCPHCEGKFKLGSDKVGKKIKCPKCSNIFVVEELSLTAPPTAAPKTKPKAEAPKAEAAPQVAKPKAAAPPPAKEIPPPAEEKLPAPAQEEVVPLKDRPKPLKVSDFFETQHTRFIPEKAIGVDAYVAYEITGDGGGFWSLRIKDGTCEIKEGPAPDAKSHAKMSDKTYLKIAMGKQDPRVAFMLGKLKIKGDKASLATVRECFQVPEV